MCGHGVRIIVAILIVFTSTALGEVRYALTDLGTLGGGRSSASCINNFGQVVGGSATTGEESYHAFLYSGGTMTDLGTLVGSSGESTACGINNLGQIVGRSSAANGYHAFLYSGGQMTDIDTLGTDFSEGRAINDSGQITGECRIAGLGQRAFLYQQGAMQNLGIAFSGAGSSAGRAIDVDGRVFGYTIDEGGIGRAATFSNGWTILWPDLEDSDAKDVNARGDIVGVTNGGAYTQHGILYSGSTITHLGTFSNEIGAGSGATAINGAGQVVGWSSLASGQSRAVIYENGQPVDLNSLIPADSGWVLTYASDINDSGLIVGNAISPDSIERAFLLTPVPEPASLALLTMGSLAIIHRRRSR